MSYYNLKRTTPGQFSHVLFCAHLNIVEWNTGVAPKEVF